VIRERSFLDLLDLTILVIRARPLSIMLAALLGIVPWAGLNLWLLADPELSRVYWVILLALETPWATAPLTLVLGDLMLNKPPRPGRMFKTLLESLPAMIGLQLVVRVILLFTVVVIPAQYSFLDEIILLERRSLRAAPQRSRELSSGFGGELFIRWLGQLFLGTIFALCFWASARTLSSAMIGDDLTWYRPGLSDLSGVLFQAGVWIAIAFFGVYRFLAYIDRRTRLEGWELDLRLKAVTRELRERST
jgi:hypothetical protein